MQNMFASAILPLTVDASGRSRFDLVTLRPVDANRRWFYTWQYHFEIGRRSYTQPANFAYALPYVNERHKVIQGYGGGFSHQAGSRFENAIDFEMPVGTTVCAARDGVVVALRQDSNVGGPDLIFEPCCNYVVIRHNDGTFAMYAHLQQNSVRVKSGQEVKVHEPLALSGNTGRSSRPHLHFDVFWNVDGNMRKTIPVQFKTKPGIIETLKVRETYP